MRIGLGTPTRAGVKAKPVNPQKGPGANIGVKGASASFGNTKGQKGSAAVPVGTGNGNLGVSPMREASAPQADFGKTGMGDPTGPYGKNANVQAGKYHK